MKLDDSLFEDKPYSGADMDDSMFEDVPFEDTNATGTIEAQPEEETSFLESLLRGGAQGASFGFSDEATAAAESGLGKLGVLPEKSYEQALGESRAAYDKAREDNPTTTFAGDVLGGVGAGLATGGASAVASIGKAGLKQALPKLAAIGAAEGGLRGAGETEDITNIPQAATDIGLGAGVGAGAGVLLPTAVQATKSVAKSAANLPIVKDVLDSFDFAKAGKSVVGDEAKEVIKDEAKGTAKDLLGAFESQYKTGSSKINRVLSSLSEDPINRSGKEIQQLEKLLETSKLDPNDLPKIEAVLNRVREEMPIKGSGVAEARKTLDKTISKLKAQADALGDNVSFTPPEVNTEADILQTIMRGNNAAGEDVARVLQQDIPVDQMMMKYKDLNVQQLQDLKKQVSDLAYGGNLEKFSEAKLKQFAKAVDDQLKKVLQGSNAIRRSAYESGNKEMSDVYTAGEIYNRIPAFRESPEKAITDTAADILGTSERRDLKIDELPNYLKKDQTPVFDKMDELYRRNQLNKAAENKSTNIGFKGLGGSVDSMMVRGGDMVGRASRAVEQSKPVSIAKDLINLPNEQLSNMSKMFASSDNEAVRGFATVLDKAIKDVPNRDKLIWSLSQQPAFRQMVKEYTDQPLQNSFSEEENEQPDNNQDTDQRINDEVEKIFFNKFNRR